MKKYIDPDGDIVEAFLFVDKEELPKGFIRKTVTERQVSVDDKGLPQIDEVEVERVFIPTKDQTGDYSIEGRYSSIGSGNWVLKHSNGEISICSPKVFEQQYTEHEEAK